MNCNHLQFIDLSYKFNNETLYWGTSTRFQHKLVYEGPLLANNVSYYSAYDYSGAEHGGTHMDAPIHFAEGKWSVDQIPPEKLVGEAVVVNISVKSAADRNARLTVDDLEKWESEHGAIPKGSILFVFNDWGKHWPSYEKYFGTATKIASLYRFPGIHEDAATWLVANRDINGVGIDTPSIDYGKSKSYPTHQILFKKNIFGLENVANLDKLPATGYIVYALPMNIEGGSGGPVRILATMKSTTNRAGINFSTSCGIFAVMVVAIALLHVNLA